MKGPEAITLSAPAKVNLFLSVGARRDDGYHEVTTIVQALRLSDTVTMEPAGSLEVSCSPDPGVPAEHNLASVAAVALGEGAGRDPGAAIAISKRIPAAAGLGGGSSDAAAVIRGLCSWWGLDPVGETALAAAARAGADVPFFLYGGAVVMSGRGDSLVRRLAHAPLEIVLVGPGVPVPTGAAYAAFDRIGVPGAPSPHDLAEALASGDARRVAASLHNDLAGPSVDVAPEVGDALAFLARCDGVLGYDVAGSGSCVYGVCEGAGAAEAAADAARERDWWAAATTTSAHGVREEER